MTTLASPSILMPRTVVRPILALAVINTQPIFAGRVKSTSAVRLRGQLSVLTRSTSRITSCASIRRHSMHSLLAAFSKSTSTCRAYLHPSSHPPLTIINQLSERMLAISIRPFAARPLKRQGAVSLPPRYRSKHSPLSSTVTFLVSLGRAS